MPKQPFSKRRVPWHTPFPILKRRQRLARLKRKGFLKPLTKAEARIACQQAIKQHDAQADAQPNAQMNSSSDRQR